MANNRYQTTSVVLVACIVGKHLIDQLQIDVVPILFRAFF